MLSTRGKSSDFPSIETSKLLTKTHSFVQTDMGNTGAQFFGMKEAPTTTKDAVAYTVNEVVLVAGFRGVEYHILT